MLRMLWALFAVMGAATVLYALDGIRQHNHLHLHPVLILCDLMLVAYAVYTTLNPPK